MRPARSLRRQAAVAGTLCLLLAASVACGPAEGSRAPADTVRDAVDQMTAEESATVSAELDARAGEVRALLKELGVDGGKRRAQRLAKAEIAVAVEADGPLNELKTYGPKTRLAMALSLGDRDAVAYKSIGDQVYLRVQLEELIRRGELTAGQRGRLKELAGLAEALPGSLHSTKRLLTGGWVRMTPKAFADYGWALEEFTGLSLEEYGGLRGTSTVLDGSELRAVLGRLEDVLTDHSTYRKTGEKDGVQTMRVELPARRTAKALAPLLRPLGAAVEPSQVPERRVPAELTIRRGALSELTLDLGALTDGGTAQVPLRLSFSPGDVFSPNPPNDAVELEPQDLLAAALYAATRPSSGAAGS